MSIDLREGSKDRASDARRWRKPLTGLNLRRFGRLRPDDFKYGASSKRQRGSQSDDEREIDLCFTVGAIARRAPRRMRNAMAAKLSARMAQRKTAAAAKERPMPEKSRT
jgi:hypothetical protein